MAKRKEIEVDEDLIKSMMTGDIPRLNQQPNKEENIPETNMITDSPVIEKKWK